MVLQQKQVNGFNKMDNKKRNNAKTLKLLFMIFKKVMTDLRHFV